MQSVTPIVFDILSGDSQRPQLTLSNISRSGMFLQSANPVQPGVPLDEAFVVQTGKSLQFTMRLGHEDCEVSGVACVRWIRKKNLGPQTPWGIGVQVIEFHENTEKRYLDFLEACLLKLKITDLMDATTPSAPDSATLGETLRLFHALTADCVVVVNKIGTPCGILTKADALQHLLGCTPPSKVINECMSPILATVSVEQSLEHAYGILLAGTTTHLPVLDDGILIGVLSTKDLVPYWSEYLDLRAKRLLRSYDMAMSVIAHDLRTPISVIQTTNALLTSNELSPEEYIRSGFPEVLESTCTTMMHLIDDLLDLNKIKAGVIRLERVLIDVEELITKVTRSFTALAASKKISIDVDFSMAIPKIKADPLRLEQVLNNLIGNALKFSPAGKRVVVGAKPHHSQVAIWVADNGPGIPPSDIDSLFNEFNTLTNRASAGEKSTGLGLAIVKKLVEAHDGNIRVSSEPMHGTTFTVFLPIGEIQ